MTDDESARLRKLAEREVRDRHDAAQWCASHSERDDRDEWAYVSLMDLRNAVDGATILALLDERDAAMALIAAHNAECARLCHRDIKGGRCEAYVSRGRECTDCPRDWVIDETRSILGGDKGA
ncbi:MAG: hypothetical protein KA200_00040 [Burkholderiales bacterium]|nr:hypothetical protein [Burkholderiales bacterium]